MKVNTKKEIKITLVLNEREARYLMGLTQNFMGKDLSDEDPNEQSMRYEIFEGLKQSLYQ